MPFIRVTHNAALSPDAEQAILDAVTALMQDILGKKGALTSVLVESIKDGGWLVGGSRRSVCAHAEANITAGTNSAEEKAKFIGEMMALLHAQLGTLPEATYVIVREIAATDWGYDGLTQDARRSVTA